MGKFKEVLLSQEAHTIGFVLLTVRATFVGSNIGDAIGFIAICGLVGYSKYLKSLKQNPINDEVKAELSRVNMMVSELSMKKAIKSDDNFLNIRKF